MAGSEVVVKVKSDNAKKTFVSKAVKKIQAKKNKKPVKKKTTKKKVVPKKPVDKLKKRVVTDEKKLKEIKNEIKKLKKEINSLKKIKTQTKNIAVKLDKDWKKTQKAYSKTAKNLSKLKSVNSDLAKTKARQFENAKKLTVLQGKIKQIEQFDKKLMNMQNFLDEKEKSGAFASITKAEEEIAHDILRLYFQEIARLGFKRQLDLDSIINAYYYTLEKLKEKNALKEVKKMREQPVIVQNIMQTAPTPQPTTTSGAYKHTNRKGDSYYLHNRGKLYYFSRDPEGGVPLPSYLEVKESKTGLPMVKKK